VWKTILNLVIAVLIIGAGAGAGWLIATLTNPYATPSPVAAATVTAVPANRTVTGGTPAPATTTAAGAVTPGSSNTTPAATSATTPGAGQQTGGQAGAQRPQTAQVTGKVQSYDVGAKKLTITTAEGVRTLNVSSTRFTKAFAFKSDELNQYATTPLLVAGERGADGTITARSITAVELGGQGQAGGARPGGGGLGGGALGQGGTILVSSSFKDGILTGQTFQGESVKVAINTDTRLQKQAIAADTDLKEGLEITATLRATTGDTPEAVTVTISG
jgi:Cu/Ag efflux protein CusF